ncbi:MAG: hypothetical protein HC887_00745 [Desulfobacteraceae bacterium]|nr:hypothetical protein [Desulfobacteraceae bacterium]
MTDESGSTFTLQPSDSIRLQNNASVSTSSSGQGDAGNILLTTSELDMDSSASVSSGSLSEGNGGDGGAIGIGKEIVMKNTDTEDERFSVTQPADTIRLSNHANINSSSKGYGDAGEIGLGVSDLELDSSALISSVGKNGQGGMIIIAGTIDEPENEQFTTPEFADHIRLHGNSAITTSSEGYGDAGDIRLKTRHLEMHDASVSSDADFSGGGRISVNAEDTVYLTGSRITTNVYQGIGNGGDIELSAKCKMQSAKCGAGVVILNHSEIQANADEGDGGAVFIVTDNFLKSFGSIVEATSERGNEGTVRIEAPDLDISGKLVVMPDTFFNAEKWIYDICESRSGKARGRFSIRRYVVPPDMFGDEHDSLDGFFTR